MPASARQRFRAHAKLKLREADADDSALSRRAANPRPRRPARNDEQQNARGVHRHVRIRPPALPCPRQA